MALGTHPPLDLILLEESINTLDLGGIIPDSFLLPTSSAPQDLTAEMGWEGTRGSMLSFRPLSKALGLPVEKPEDSLPLGC